MTGLFSVHCSLCLGLDEEGKPLHARCILCGGNDFSSENSAKGHYRQHHQIHLSASYTARDVYRQYRPESHLDINFNQSYGSLFTHEDVTSKEIEPRVHEYITLYRKTPALIQYKKLDIIDGHRDAFESYFQCQPISLHNHVSDALNLDLLKSFIMHLEQSATSPDQLLGRTKDPASPARLIVMEGAYGAGYGPLAYHSAADYSNVAHGPHPVVLHLNSRIASQIRDAKRQGFFAPLVEIVRSRDGLVMTPDRWGEIVAACHRWGLVLIVDEAQTAIRCGAPFSYQRSAYSQYGRPDLVLFGKGIRVSGIAVDWAGINISKLNITDYRARVDVGVRWQLRVTTLDSPDSLLQSWGTIVAAQKQQWTQRAVDIGSALRQVLASFRPPPSSGRSLEVRGLDALIWLRREQTTPQHVSMVIPAAAGGAWFRWFPMLTRRNASLEHLMADKFSERSNAVRREHAAYLQWHGWDIGYCSICGEAMETGLDREGARPPCLDCATRPCEFCEPGEHACRFRQLPS